jgi:tRNA A37 threonylcarbamoyladenosine dehydratase
MFSGIRELISPTITAAASVLIVFSTVLLVTVELLRRRGERLRGINPAIELDLRQQFLTPSNLGELLDAPGDLVLDACDSFRSKVEGLPCRRRSTPSYRRFGGWSQRRHQIRVRDLHGPSTMQCCR